MTGLLTWAYVLAAGSVLDPLYTGLGWVMAVLYSVLPSYGIAIILLTVAVRLVLYPLTVKQTKSMQAMQRLQPEIKRLQAKYKNDRQKLNEEMMKFYKENKVNPLSGCLPLVLQLPLFIVLYRLIHDLTVTVISGALILGSAGSGGVAAPVQMTPTGGIAPQTVATQNVKVSDGAISTVNGQKVLNGSVTADVLNDGKVVGELHGAVIDGQVYKSGTGAKDKTKAPAEVLDPAGKAKIGTIDGAQVPAAPDSRADGAKLAAHPKHIPETSQLAKDLRKTPGHMEWLGLDLAKRPSQGKGNELIGLYLLVILTVITGYYQQRQMTARTPASAQNQQMQMMGRIFPVFFGFIALQVPAGVVLYFVVSNIWQIGQQAIIFRQQDAADAAKKAAGGPKGARPAVEASSKPANPAPSAPNSPAKANAPAGNPSSSGKAGSNPSNRSRRRRRRRKGR
ncbi:MAG: YidC/Oxa1 family membrane protein insertase [Acidimicrobiia bacterium]|nr:YidC/Oxa1 family membrane protein insertase [Acidimicrobiia bacterium]